MGETNRTFEIEESATLSSTSVFTTATSSSMTLLPVSIAAFSPSFSSAYVSMDAASTRALADSSSSIPFIPSIPSMPSSPSSTQPTPMKTLDEIHGSQQFVVRRGSSVLLPINSPLNDDKKIEEFDGKENDEIIEKIKEASNKAQESTKPKFRMDNGVPAKLSGKSARYLNFSKVVDIKTWQDSVF